VPRGLQGTAIPFSLNDIESLRETIRGRESKIAAIVIEPARGEDSSIEKLQALRDIASELGAVLIFDEITSGYRMCAGGIHRRYGVYPDIAVFAKSMANGYAMSAILGTEEVMQAAQSTFISSTNWTDRVGPVAALATLKKYQATQADKHIKEIGEKTKNIWRDAAAKIDLSIEVTGLPSLVAFAFNGDNSQDLNTRFVTEMLQRGFLGFRQFKPSLAHGQADLEQYATAVYEVFKLIKDLSSSEILASPVAHAGFYRLTKE
jgi:glutamate-1-semialdehyde aminotransferase